MSLVIDWGNKIIQVTSPTTSVDAQTLHDFVEDEMATPEGLCYADILQPEGKIEDPTNPGVYSQIILVLNSLWQIQFWGGSGYTKIYGAKIVGGVSDEPMKATGTAGDITVLESPVDGLTITPISSVTSADVDNIVDGVLDEDIRDHGNPYSFGAIQQQLILNDKVYIDTNSSYTGSTFPTGSIRYPVNNLADAITIATANRLKELYVIGTITININVSNFIITGVSIDNTTIISSATATTVGTHFNKCTISGYIAGSTTDECKITSLTNFNGYVYNSIFDVGCAVLLANSLPSTFINCTSSDLFIDMGSTGQSLTITRHTGDIQLDDKDGEDLVVIDLISGFLKFTELVIGGIILCKGVGQITEDLSKGAVIYDSLVDMSDDVKAPGGMVRVTFVDDGTP